MRTSCKDCFFAVLENAVQTGCKLKRLDIYKAKNVATLVDDHYEVESFCKTVRTAVWAGKLTESPEEAVKKEAANKYSVIIKYNGSVKDLETTINSLVGVYQIVLVNAGEIKEDKAKIWSLLVDKRVKYSIMSSYEENLVDSAFSAIDGNYYCVLQSGKKMPKNLLKRATEEIDKKLNTILVFDNRKVKLFSTSLHKSLGGNKEKPLFEKLVNSSDKQLAAIADKSLKETRYHLKHSSEWVIRLGDGTVESHDRIQNSLNNLLRYADELFYSDEIGRAHV
jgi:hypothetical protein